MEPDGAGMIEFKRVWKKFGSQVVVRDLSLKVEDGEIFFILGKTGAGKTVLIRMLAGLLKPEQGEIWLEDKRVDLMTEDALKDVRRKCGLIFQSPTLFDSLKVFENIAFGLRRHFDFSEAEIEARVRNLLELVHLDPQIADQYPEFLSFGMQKRVSLARTIALEPKYLLYDEPTTGLDPFTARQINQLIKELRDKLQVTSIVVSHDLESMREVSDRVGLLEDGRFVEIAPTGEFEKSSNPLVRRFLEAV
jgi:phospholipid/cholesterol/gamma-HCH transport system ATP-binding protein